MFMIQSVVKYYCFVDQFSFYYCIKIFEMSKFMERFIIQFIGLEIQGFSLVSQWMVGLGFIGIVYMVKQEIGYEQG